jgi:hypothetical protein
MGTTATADATADAAQRAQAELALAAERALLRLTRDPGFWETPLEMAWTGLVVLRFRPRDDHTRLLAEIAAGLVAWAEQTALRDEYEVASGALMLVYLQRLARAEWAAPREFEARLRARVGEVSSAAAAPSLHWQRSPEYLYAAALWAADHQDLRHAVSPAVDSLLFTHHRRPLPWRALCFAAAAKLLLAPEDAGAAARVVKVLLQREAQSAPDDVDTLPAFWLCQRLGRARERSLRDADLVRRTDRWIERRRTRLLAMAPDLAAGLERPAGRELAREAAQVADWEPALDAAEEVADWELALEAAEEGAGDAARAHPDATGLPERPRWFLPPNDVILLADALASGAAFRVISEAEWAEWQGQLAAAGAHTRPWALFYGAATLIAYLVLALVGAAAVILGGAPPQNVLVGAIPAVLGIPVLVAKSAKDRANLGRGVPEGVARAAMAVVLSGLVWIALSLPAVSQALGIQTDTLRTVLFTAVITAVAAALLAVLYWVRVFR